MKETNENTHKIVCEKLNKLYVSKNQDYGSSFSDTFKEFGLIASVIRLNDKVNRLKTLTKNENLVKDESILDTLYDLANYSILTIMELEKEL